MPEQTQLFAIADTANSDLEFYLQRDGEKMLPLQYGDMMALAMKYGDLENKNPSAFKKWLTKVKLTRDTGYEPSTKVMMEIMNGRVDINLLINTLGGSFFTVYECMHLKKLSSEYGGKMRAFTTNKAMSMGVYLSFMVERKYAKCSTEFTFHRGTVVTNAGTREPNPMKDGMDALNRGYFNTLENSKAKTDALARIDIAQNDQGNPDGVFSFTGEELRKLGIIHEVFDTTEEVRKKCVAETGVDIELSKRANPVGIFFITSEIEELLYRETGEHIGLIYDPKSKDIKFAMTWAKPEIDIDAALRKSFAQVEQKYNLSVPPFAPCS